MKNYIKNEHNNLSECTSEQTLEQKYNNKRFKFFETEDKYELWISGEFPCMYYGFENDSPDMIHLIRDLRNSNKNKELHIFIDSYGGYTDSLLLLVNEILKFKHVVTVTTSVAQSCGAYLFLTGHEKYVSKNSMLCFHGTSTGVDAKVEEIKHYIEKTILQYEILDKQLCIDKFLTKEEIEKTKTTEVFLSGEDIINRGLAIDYSYYLDRQLPKKLDVFEVNNNFIAIKNNNEKYSLISKQEYENIFSKLKYDLSFSDIIKINNNLILPITNNDIKNNKIKKENKKESIKQNKNKKIK